MHTPWAGAGHYAIFMKQAIAPIVRVPERHRHLRRPRPARRHRRRTTTRPRSEWLREFCADATSTTSRPSWSKGLARLPAPEDAVAFAREVRDPERQHVHDAVGQDRAVLDGARRRARPLRARPHPADPDLDPEPARRARAGRSSCVAEVAGADALDARQPGGPRAGRPPGRLDPSRRRRAPGDRRRRTASASSTTAAAPCCPPTSRTGSRPASCRSRRARGSRRASGRTGHAAAPTS